MTKHFKITPRGCIALLFGVILLASVGCGHYFEDNVVDESSVGTIQAIRDPVAIDETLPPGMGYQVMGITSTSEGYYSVSYNGKYYVTYYDISTDTLSEWCSRADCEHTDASICSSVFAEDMYCRWIQAYDGYVYQIRFAEDGGYLMRRDKDGSNLTQLSKLWDANAAFNDVTSDKEASGMTIHSGYIYYVVTEDYSNMAIWRTALDGSVEKELVYEWVDSSATLSHGMKCSKEYVYIYGSSWGTYEFIQQYNPKTGEIEEIYTNSKSCKLLDGEAGTIVVFSVLEDYVAYELETGAKYMCTDEYEDKKELDKSIILQRITPDGKYCIIYKTYTDIAIFDMDGNELACFNEDEQFPDLEYGGTLLVQGADNRYFFFFVSAHNGIFALDRRDVDEGIINFKKIAVK